jgi:hypothetical protein
MPEPLENDPHLSPGEKKELSRLLQLTPEEAAEELRAAGIDPHELARRLFEKCKDQIAAIEKERQAGGQRSTQPNKDAVNTGSPSELP